jgi:uncharacterized membrane protein YgcG
MHLFEFPPLLAQELGPFDLLRTTTGPDWLAIQFVCFLVTFFPVLVLRLLGRAQPWMTYVALGIFEGVGAARMIVGHWYGLHKWNDLLLILILGGVVFFLRAVHFTSEGGDSSSGCSSGGGGCGGGGGCRGCGGD